MQVLLGKYSSLVPRSSTRSCQTDIMWQKPDLEWTQQYVLTMSVENAQSTTPTRPLEAIGRSSLVDTELKAPVSSLTRSGKDWHVKRQTGKHTKGPVERSSVSSGTIGTGLALAERRIWVGWLFCGGIGWPQVEVWSGIWTRRSAVLQKLATRVQMDLLWHRCEHKIWLRPSWDGIEAVYLRLLQVRLSFFSSSSVIAIVLSRSGKLLPESVYKERSQTRDGLNLSRGPDPRSFHASLTRTPVMWISTVGLDLWDRLIVLSPKRMGLC